MILFYYQSRIFATLAGRMFGLLEKDTISYFFYIYYNQLDLKHFPVAADPIVIWQGSGMGFAIAFCYIVAPKGEKNEAS